MYRPGEWLNPVDRPAWCEITAAGRFTVPVEGGRFDRHYHHDHEIWFIAAGRARILVDGALRYVRAGDMVLTRAGDEHDVVEVYQTVHGFFVETGHPPGGRAGHLHRDPALAAGHDVPARPVPADFDADAAAGGPDDDNGVGGMAGDIAAVVEGGPHGPAGRGHR